MKLFITGGSGFLGSALFTRLIEDTAVRKVFLLLRHNSRTDAAGRLNDLIARTCPPERRALAQEKTEAVPGDLTLADLGLSALWQERLVKECDQIVHLGASTDFGASLDESRRINVEGTARLLTFAERCKAEGVLRRFDYVSTAFVAGTRAGEVREDDLARDQGFANPYEQSKYEAEILVRNCRARLPLAVYRPSIVVGDSRTGFTPHFKALYWPLQLLAKNVLTFIPCNRHAYLDIVPVDFVADALHCLLRAPESIGQTFHLTAGRGAELTVGGFLRDAFQFTGIKRRPIMPLWAFNLLRHTPLRRLLTEDFWRAAQLASGYTAYLAGTGVVFNAARTHAVLKKNRIAPPPWRDYRRNVLTYCVSSRWGKRPAPPEYLYRNPVLAP